MKLCPMQFKILHTSVVMLPLCRYFRALHCKKALCSILLV
jgi:hypothetical protein